MYEEQPAKSAIVSPTYISYLVRLWRLERSSDWLASLEAPGTHERYNFADLKSFFDFLRAQTGSEPNIRGSTERHGTSDDSALDLEPP